MKITLIMRCMYLRNIGVRIMGMRRIFGFALLTLVAAAQDRPAITAQPNTVYVGADGKYEAAPDTALEQFNISAQEDTPQAAYGRASRASEQIRQILRSNGIDPKTAEIGFFSLQPVYDYRTPKRKLVKALLWPRPLIGTWLSSPMPQWIPRNRSEWSSPWPCAP